MPSPTVKGTKDQHALKGTIKHSVTVKRREEPLYLCFFFVACTDE